MDVAHIGGDGTQTLGIVNRHAAILVAVVQGTLVGMTHGQETERPVGSIANGIMEILELVHQIMVREHHTLGRSRGA